ncbi:hypothetical protein [Tenacibaculum sp. SDUM215027]
MENKYLKETAMSLNPGGDTGGENDLTEGGNDTGGATGSDGGD